MLLVSLNSHDPFRHSSPCPSLLHSPPLSSVFMLLQVHCFRSEEHSTSCPSVHIFNKLDDRSPHQMVPISTITRCSSPAIAAASCRPFQRSCPVIPVQSRRITLERSRTDPFRPSPFSATPRVVRREYTTRIWWWLKVQQGCPSSATAGRRNTRSHQKHSKHLFHCVQHLLF